MTPPSFNVFKSHEWSSITSIRSTPRFASDRSTVLAIRAGSHAFSSKPGSLPPHLLTRTNSPRRWPIAFPIACSLPG